MESWCSEQQTQSRRDPGSNSSADNLGKVTSSLWDCSPTGDNANSTDHLIGISYDYAKWSIKCLPHVKKC